MSTSNGSHAGSTTPNVAVVLRNDYLEAHIGDDGTLVALSDATANGGGYDPPVAYGVCHYRAAGATRSERDGTGESFQVVSLDGDPHRVVAVVATPVVAVRRTYELGSDAPLLSIAVEVSAAAPISGGLVSPGPETVLTHTAFPQLQFGQDFADAFEDEEDLAFDGEELAEGHELPCWRVFFRGDRAHGLLLATRSKLDMSRMQILERGFAVRPHAMVAYDTHTLNPPLQVSADTRHTCNFEIGPWRRADHQQLLDVARLEAPVPVASPPLTGSPPPRVEGNIYPAAGFAADAAVAVGFAPDRWMLVPHPCSVSGQALHAGPSVQAPPLTLDPGLRGVYRIYVGICNGDGITLRLSSDAQSTFRQNTHTAIPFHLKLAGAAQATELVGPIADMTGQSLTLSRFPSNLASTIIDYVRFERLDEERTAQWQRRGERTAPVPISGFNDIPDIGKFTDATDPSPEPYKVNLWEHANCGVNTVYWRIDGQCSDFPSRHNTMRYVSARVHDVFQPHKKAYGRVLKKVDMLAYAVEAAREYGLRLYGWQRFNNYHGNVQSDFYRNNPQLWEEFEDGERGRKLCLAHPEVRRHKIDILVEAAGYGLDGLVLGFLRHPPVLLYAPALVEGYRQRYDKLPPRNRPAADPRHLVTLPEADPEYQQWFAYRAQFMTEFGRELRAALRAAKLEHVKVALWVRPNHCLFDGIDLERWLDEGLCDEVIADAIVARYFHERPVCDVQPEWKQMVQAKVPLIRGVSCFDFAHARAEVPGILGDGYDGISVYESDLAVYDSNWIALFDWLRDGAHGEPPGAADAPPTAG